MSQTNEDEKNLCWVRLKESDHDRRFREILADLLATSRLYEKESGHKKDE
jgi:hypothetical protein